MKTAGCIGAILVVLAPVLGIFFAIYAVAAFAVNASEPDAAIPPELEAAYRQVGARTGVDWAILAAWDGAENRFALPIPSVDELYATEVRRRLDAKRRAAEAWCREHPSDTDRCPPEPPELTSQEQEAAWRSAYASWHQALVGYISGRASRLSPLMPEFEQDPEAVYRRFLSSSSAGKAADLFEGYQLLDQMAEDADTILVPPSEPPADWVPVDGFAWPVVAPITSRFGMRVSPIDGVYRLHAGIDLGVASGTPLRASKAGTVTAAEWSDVYGLMVVIDHGDGYETVYAHNSALAVRPGQVVEQGQIISQSGATGYATGPHLHFEIHYHGTPIDPLLLLT